MPFFEMLPALKAGVKWGWTTFPQYLDKLRGNVSNQQRIGINTSVISAAEVKELFPDLVTDKDATISALIGAGLDEKLQHWATVVEDAVDGVKHRRLATETVVVSIRRCVDIRSRIQEYLCASHGVELGADVKRCDAFAGCESARHAKPVFHCFLPTCLHQLSQIRSVIQDERFEDGIDRRAGVDQHLEATGETRRAQVPLDQALDGTLPFDRCGRTRTGGQRGTNPFGRVFLEGTQVIGFKRHVNVAYFIVAPEAMIISCQIVSSVSNVEDDCGPSP
jgi:hypothetical protein